MINGQKNRWIKRKSPLARGDFLCNNRVISKTQNYPASSLHWSGFDSETVWHSASRHDPSAPDRSCSLRLQSSLLQLLHAKDVPHSSSNSVLVPCVTSSSKDDLHASAVVSENPSHERLLQSSYLMRNSTAPTPTRSPLLASTSALLLLCASFLHAQATLQQETKR
jgi:hypothetical protein